MAAGSFIYAGLTILFAMNTLPWLALLLCILMGPAYQIRDVSQQTILQTETPIHDLSKVYAAHYVLSSVSVGLSIFFVGMIADAFGARFVYLLGGLFVLICSGIAITTFMMQKKERLFKAAALYFSLTSQTCHAPSLLGYTQRVSV